MRVQQLGLTLQIVVQVCPGTAPGPSCILRDRDYSGAGSSISIQIIKYTCQYIES